ncbi:MAG: hypothetical protein ACREFQ_17460, partial [Stellaceae bacterium]
MTRSGLRRRTIVVGAAAGALLPRIGTRGSPDLAAAPSTRWSLATRDGVSWLVTPGGRRFFSLGVNTLDGGRPLRAGDGRTHYSWTGFAPSLADWVAAARQRLTRWGFNSAGGWSLP